MNSRGQLGLLIAAMVFGLVALTVITIFGGYIGLGLKTVSAQNFEKNYEWFKSQETAIKQIQNQVCVSNDSIKEFKALYGDVNGWTKTTKDQYGELSFVKNGYISKYNLLVSEYNARRASFIKSFGRDPQIPQDYARYYDALCG